MDPPDVLLPHSLGADRLDRLAPAVRDRLGGLGLDGDPAVRAPRTAAGTEAVLPEIRVAITGRFPAAYLDRADRLAWLQTVSAGVDYLDLDRIEAAGVALTNASGVHAEPIGEQVLGYLLTFERGLHRAARQQARGVWERIEGGELRGKTLGIVGVGAIGSRAAELATAVGMTTVGTKRDPATGGAAVDELHGPDGLHAVLEASEYLLVACPLTEDTRGLIGREELLALGSDAVVINIARGPVIDESALTWALQQGVIRGAALDVFEEEPLPAESPLWDLSNVVITPHMAGSSPHKTDRLADLFAANYLSFVTEGPAALENRVL